MTKRVLLLVAFVALVATFLVSCGVENKPGPVAQAFLTAYRAQDYNKSAEFLTDEAKTIIPALEAAKTAAPAADAATGEAAPAPTAEEKAAADAEAKKVVKVDNVDEKGDSAFVTWSVEGGEPQTIEMVKVKGQWKVGNDPVVAAEAFLTKIRDLEFSGAGVYATEQTRYLLDMMQGFMANLTPEQLAEAEKQKAMVIKMGKVEVSGDNAKVFFTMGEQPEGFVDLIKDTASYGAWRVQFNKGA